MSEENFDKAAAVKLLNQIMEAELAGVVRYTHYSLMVFGHNRIPIVSWLRNEANTCLAHANEAGELVTHFGEHPSLKIGALLETHKHGINDILIESLEAENTGLALYKQLFDLVRDRSVLLEDYARRMIAEEELHVGEVNKMLRKPGEITQFEADIDFHAATGSVKIGELYLTIPLCIGQMWRARRTIEDHHDNIRSPNCSLSGATETNPHSTSCIRWSTKNCTGSRAAT